MFWVRLASSVVIVIVMAASLKLGGVVLNALLCFVSIVGLEEMLRALGVHKKENRPLETVPILGTVVIYVLLAVQSVMGQYVADDVTPVYGILVFTVILLLAVYVIRFPYYHAAQIIPVVFAFVYVPVMLSFISLTSAIPDIGHKAVWLIFVSAWGSDTCAYCVGLLTGKTIGNHQAFPRLSPHKSVEGCVGGIVGAALLGALFGNLLFGAEYAGGVAFVSGVGSVISQCGDLAASAIKRDFNIKDYGKLIPGHGGILDRFDSVIFTAPCVYFLMYLLPGFTF
ncbi:MAG: phosphatidate cytidylyltransferase [Lachnospiraceae bacterium]|nr:phosphatidate cytidylyltransferase [Lachnospiraceae bacterium]